MNVPVEARASGAVGAPRTRVRSRVPSAALPSVAVDEVNEPQNQPALLPRRSFLRFETAAELMATPEKGWLVPGVVAAGGLAALFGPSGSGKSFLALDMSLALATGQRWFGRPLRATPVTYLCLEGGDGFGKRVRAWSMRHGRAHLPGNLKFMRGHFRLQYRHHREEIAAMIRQNDVTGGLVVVDTLSRAYGDADENSGSDMGEILHACNELQQEAQVTLLLVHHTGKDTAKGLRGHSSLRAALDSAIEVRSASGRREWLVSKSKDGEDGERNAFALTPIEVGTDADGQPVTSCVVDAIENIARALQAAEGPTGRNQLIVISILNGLFAESQELGKGGAPATAKCVRFEDALAATAPMLECKEPRRRRERARMVINTFVGKGRYGLGGGWLWERTRAPAS